MEDKEYFALKRLSASGVKKLLRTPANFIVKQEETPAMRFGTLVHCLVLEPETFESRFAIMPEGLDKRTKEGRAKFQELEESGKQIISFQDYCLAESINNSVQSHEFSKSLSVFYLLKDSEKEVVEIWDQEFSFGVVQCKAKIDIVNHENKLILDLKTVADASERSFQATIYGETGYHLQAEFYRMQEKYADYKFGFVVAEKVEPFCTAIYLIDDSARFYSRQKIERAAMLYKNGLESGVWIKQLNKAQVLTMPNWFGKE